MTHNSGSASAFDATVWLNGHVPGYSELSAHAREAITTFSLLWTLFEGRVLNESANATAILKLCEELIEDRRLRDEDFREALTYFRDRYAEDGQLGYHFRHLNLRKNDRGDIVEKVLLAQSPSTAEELAACLIIAYRYRSNYFHGIKWKYQFHDQQKNFETSNKLLALVMERSPHIRYE